MARNRLFALLEARIESATNDAMGRMAAGGCPDFGGYQWSCGYIRALTEVIEFINEIEAQRE